MPKGIYPRKKRKASPPQQANHQEQHILFTDTTRMDMLEAMLCDTEIFRPRFTQELLVVRCGLTFGKGRTVREALDDYAKKRE